MARIAACVEAGTDVWISDASNAAHVLDLKTQFDAKEEILRYLIIKTVRENTYVPAEIVSDEVVDTPEVLATEAVVEAMAPKVTEDLDKSIDALVTE